MMQHLNTGFRRLLKARYFVLLVGLLPVAVFSLVLNDSRQFIIPLESSAKAFAAAAGPRAAVGDIPLIGGLFIEPPLPGEDLSNRRLPTGNPIGFADQTPGGVRVLALAEPGRLPQPDYSPDQLINLPSGRGLPGFQQANEPAGGSIGTLAPASVPTDIAPPPGIPEPESWALMAFGMTIVGYAVRRRRRGFKVAAQSASV